jgi:hypothetical protein
MGAGLFTAVNSTWSEGFSTYRRRSSRPMRPNPFMAILFMK